jgi:hypothetical protein
MKSFVFRMAVLCIAASAAAQSSGVIVSGVGSSGTWGTSIDFANPGSTPLRFNVIPNPRECIVGPCDFTIPASGTLTIGPESLSGPLRTIFVAPEEGSATPVVRAHVLDAASPRGAELPAVSLGSITGRADSHSLTFPGVTRNATTHSNLILGGISATPATFPTDTFAANVQLFDRDGNLLGGKLVANDCAPVAGVSTSCPDAFLIDVVAQLGVEAVEGGQLSVTMIHIDPANVPFTQAVAIWGELANVSASGASGVIAGVNP